MEHQSYSVGLDIGTTKIVAIVGRKNEHGKIEIMSVGRSKSLGVKNGIVINMQQTTNSIRTAVEQAEKKAGVPIRKVVVGIAGKHIRSLQHSDYILRDDAERMIDESDIEALKAKVKKLVMLPGEEIIHVLPQEYKVDSEPDILEPIGMHGKRLEANFHVVVGQMGSIKNLLLCVRQAGLEMEELTLEPLASSAAVLSKEEKEAGVAIVDIGGGTTDIAVFKNNIIHHTCVIPYGGGIITKDIEEGCSIIERYAEQLKVKFGSTLPDLEKDNKYVTIPGFHGRQDKDISLKDLAKIIHARVEDILNLINVELKAYGVSERKKKLIAGLVLTGGGSNLRNLRQLSNYMTGLDTRIGYANDYISNDKNQQLKNPEYATAIGLLIEGLNKSQKEEEVPQSNIEEPYAGRMEEDHHIVEDISSLTPLEESKPKKSVWGTIMDEVKKFFEDTEVN